VHSYYCGGEILARISKEQQEIIRTKIKKVAKEKFGTIGFDKTSTKEIAKEVGIAEGTLFNYFDSKTELFFEAFGDEYEKVQMTRNDDLIISSNVSEVILANFKKTVGLVLKLPRGILGELTIASVKMVKKKPERFKKLMMYDMNFMEDIAVYIEQLIQHGILIEVNERQFSEMIFSFIGFELLLYMYDKEVTKEMMLENIKAKIDILVKGYIKGGNDEY
jgi:AcrR family transcriptional regulator